MPVRERLLVIASIPLELRRALEPGYELVEKSALSGGTASGFQVAVTTSMAGANAAAMAEIPDLKLIACNGTGVEKIDLAEAARRGIAICNTPDAVTDDTADFGIALIYAVLRRVAEADRFVRAGRWTQERMPPSVRVFDKKIGIVGMGKIGQGVARRAAALGMTVAYAATRAKPTLPYTFVPEVGQLAEFADILLFACPGGEATRHLVNARILQRLGKNGFLINISRGSVVDEAALIEALRNSTIAGAGLDVFATEPQLDTRLLDLPNLVVTPHYASVTQETRSAIAEDLRSNIASFFAGGAVRNAAA